MKRFPVWYSMVALAAHPRPSQRRRVPCPN